MPRRSSQYLSGEPGQRSAKVIFGPLFAAQIRPPTRDRVEYWDRSCPGLGLRVTAAGTKTWVAMYRVGAKQVRETLGTLADVPSVGDARHRAEASMAKAKTGVHPIEEKQAAAELARRNTVAAAVKGWLEYCEFDRKLRAKTLKGYRQIMEADVLPRWGARPIADVRTADVDALLKEKASNRKRRSRFGVTGAPTQANRTKTRLTNFFKWARKQKLLVVDPMAELGWSTRPEPSRDRVLSDDELRAFWTATGEIDPVAGGVFRLLLLTGQREGEVAGMRRAEIDPPRRHWVIPAERAKNRKEHVVHLSEPALAVLAAATGADAVFPTPGRAGIDFARCKARLDAAMGEAMDGAWVLHDLRRTATSLMARLGVEPHVADRVLNHTAGTISGVAKIYNRFQYLEERRLALEALSRFICLLVEDGLAGHVAEARTKLWLRAERERGEREAAGANVVDYFRAAG